MGIARTFQNIRLFNTMTVEDNVKVGLHNQERYSGFEGVLRLPTYWKHEKAAHERAMAAAAPSFDMVASLGKMSRPVRCLMAPSVVWRLFVRLPPTLSCCCLTSLPPA